MEAVECSLVSLNNRVMTVYSHRAMIMRDRKGKNLPVKFLLTLHISEKFDDSSYGNGHAVSILPVRNVKCCGAAFHLACQEWKVHTPRSHEVGGKNTCNLSHKGLQLFELCVRECRSPESHGKVRLWTAINDWYGAVPALVDTFGQILEIFGTIDS